MNIYKKLRLELDEFRQKEIKTIEEEASERKARVWKECSHQIAALQETCPHINKKEKEDFDYHKRETWYEVWCEDCGKRLERN